MHDAPKKSGAKLLPENAYRKLEPGEVYKPIVSSTDPRAEITTWSVSLGLIMVVIFTAAAVYIALRAGSGIETAIPIAILAIFFGKMKSKRSTILENVMVQSIGQASGVVAAGAAFVVPALYLNELPVTWWHILLACASGGALGIVLIIPLRKYFVRDLHGDLPFPEATATNEILVTGESAGGGSGKILIMAFALGALFDFAIEALHLWNPALNTTVLLGDLGKQMASVGIEVNLMAIAALFGLGYIIGLRYASIIASGSVLAYVIMVPLILIFGQQAVSFGLGDVLGAATLDEVTPFFGQFVYAGESHDFSTMTPGAIFAAFVKPIGIGAIAISGLIGIIRMGKIVAGSVSLGFKGFSKKGRSEAADERTQLDMNPRNVVLIQLAATLAMGVLFFVVSKASYGAGASLKFGLVGMVVGFLLSFLFTPVAAQAIAIVGVNPVSGMTLIAVVISIGVMIMAGLTGPAGMIIALIIGTAVCTALSTSGALISDFKIGYWIGATPRQQQRWKFLGILVAAVVVAAVIPVMNEAYHFLVQDPETGRMVSNTQVLPAPQANMLAAVSKGLMTDPSNQPWLLYGLGGLVAIMLYMAGMPMLAFALGMYLPISINMAVLAGAFTAFIISRTGGSEEVRRARADQGILIASGMMAGAAIFGILTAVLRLPVVGALIQYLSVGVEFSVKTVHGEDVLAHKAQAWYSGAPGRILGFAMLVALAVACFLLARLGAKWLLSESKKPSPPGDGGEPDKGDKGD